MLPQLAAMAMCETAPLAQNHAASNFDTLRPAEQPMREGVGLDAFALRVPEAASQPLLPLLRELDGPNGVVTTAIATSEVDVKLIPVPPHLQESQSKSEAIAIFAAQSDAGVAGFHLRCELDASCRLRGMDGQTALDRVCDRHCEPDAYLCIYVSPAQEPCLLGENITGITLTPPAPPESDWLLAFFGASSYLPCVHVRCGSQGPWETLALDDSDVRWSNHPARQVFAFDAQWS